MFELRRLDASLAIFELGDASGIERDVRQCVGIAIQFAAHVLDGEILQLAREFRRALVQRLEVRAFHFVAPLHLAHQQFGIAADAQRGDVVARSVIERRQQGEIFRDVVGLAPDIFRELERDFSLGIAQHHGIRSRAGISAGSAVNIGDVNSRGGGAEG